MRLLSVLLSCIMVFSSSAALADPPHRGRGHDHWRGGKGHWREHGPRHHYRHSHRHFHDHGFYHRNRFRGGLVVIHDTSPVYIERDYVVTEPGVRYTSPEPQPVNDNPTEGRYCREYTSRASVGGRIQETYGQACQQPDGSWEIIS
jgi:hypothetical protein